MYPRIPDRIHAAQIELLVASRDWVGLLMYWFAHGHQAALEEAIQFVKEAEESLSWQPYHRDVWRFLEVARDCSGDPQSIPDEYPRALAECLDDPQIVAPERSVLHLLSLWPDWRVCELSAEVPREDLERAVRAVEAAREVPLDETPEVRARVFVVLTEGYEGMSNTAMAEDCCKRALTLYEGLVPSQPELYGPYVTDLRGFQRDLRRGGRVTRPLGKAVMAVWGSVFTRYSLALPLFACISAGVPFTDPRLYLIAVSSWYIGDWLARYLDPPPTP